MNECVCMYVCIMYACMQCTYAHRAPMKVTPKFKSIYIQHNSTQKVYHFNRPSYSWDYSWYVQYVCMHVFND